MIKKIMVTALCLLLITALVCGCAKDGGNTDNISSTDNVSSTDKVTSKTEISYSTSFDNMPEMSYESVTTYVSGDTALFEFINPGLDSFSAEIVTYSLSQDKVLGQVNLGEGIFQISLLDKGFAVADVAKNVVTYYDNSCSVTDSATVFKNNMLKFAKLSADGKYILAQNYSSELLILNSKTQKVSTLNKGKTFEKVEYYKGKFYLLGAGVSVLEPENNHYYSVLDVVSTYGAVGDYAVGINGSYLACLSTKGDKHKMINIGERPGYLIDISDYGCVSVDSGDGKTVVMFYDINNSRGAKYTQKGNIISVKQISENFAITVTKNTENVLEYKLLDLSDLKKSAIKSEELDQDALNGVKELPDYSGESKTVQLTKQLENDYGIRVMFGEDIFTMSDLGFEIMGTDEETAYDYMLKLGDYFDNYPKGLLKEAGLGRPLVLYLCDKIRNNVEGLSIYIGGYNVIYMQVGGKDEYFFSNLTHEVGHALANGIDDKLTSGWVKLMPQEVIKAYGDGIEGISVEYTADDKGKTPVWFTDVYGRSNEKEDRAMVFQKMYDRYVEGDNKLFEYDGLKKKADYWVYMLSETYDSCKNETIFNWGK